MKYRIFNPTWIQWENKDAEEREEFSKKWSIIHGKLNTHETNNWKNNITSISQYEICNTMVIQIGEFECLR